MCYVQRVICTKAAAAAVEAETHQMVEDLAINNHHIVAIETERATEMNILHTREEDGEIHMIVMILLHIHDHTTVMDIVTETKRGGEEDHRHSTLRDSIERVDSMI